MKQITMDHVSFAYDDEDVLHDFTLMIQEQEGCILLAGRNGTGKSTLLNLLAGALLPYEGEVIRDEMSIGYLPFDTPLFEHLSVKDNLRYYYRNFRGKDFDIQDSFVQEVLGTLSIDYLEQRLDKCSSGQRQKAGIAMILLSGADLIVMDEPFVAIDSKSCAGLLRLIEKQKQQTTFLLTTHTIDQLEPIADRLILLKEQNVELDTRNREEIHTYFVEDHQL